MGYRDFSASIQKRIEPTQSLGYRKFTENAITSAQERYQKQLEAAKQETRENAVLDSDLYEYKQYVNQLVSAYEKKGDNIPFWQQAVNAGFNNMGHDVGTYAVQQMINNNRNIRANPEKYQINSNWPKENKQKLLELYNSGDVNAALEYAENINKEIENYEISQLKSEKPDEYALKRAEQFVLNSDEWLGSNIISGGTSYLSSMASTFDFLFGDGKNKFSQTNEYFSELNNKWQEKSYEVARRFGDNKNYSGQVVQQVVQFLPDLILAAATSGGSTVATSGTKALKAIASSKGATSNLKMITNAVKNMAKNPMWWSSFIRTLGNDFENAQNYTDNEALATVYAVSTSSINAALEAGLGIETKLPKFLEGKGSATDFLLNIGEETVEELLQNTVSRGNEKLLLNPNKEIFSTTNRDAIFNPETMSEEALLAFLSSIAISGGTMSISHIVNAGAKNELKEIGKFAKSNIEFSQIIEYAKKSADRQIREIALNNDAKTISDEDAGLLYKYVSEDISTAMFKSGNILELNNAYDFVMNKINLPEIQNIATSAYMTRLEQIPNSDISQPYNLGVQDIDSADNNGYNNVESSNVGGGVNVVHQQRGMEEGAGEGINSNSGGEGSVQRSFEESSGAFAGRAQSYSQKDGRRTRILLKHGRAQMAYTPIEANNDTNGGRAVQIMRNIGINAELAEGAIETNESGVTTIHALAFTTPDGNVYVSSDATSSDIEIAAHEVVHVNDIFGTEAFLNYESVLCEQLDYNSEKYLDIARIINEGHYKGQYDIESVDFAKAFLREVAAYVNQFVVTDFDFATQQFAELFYDWNAVVEASRQFNKDIGADFTESANFMPENSDLQSTAGETFGFDEENTSAPNDKSYEQRVIEESQGIDSSLNAAQRRINKIAEKLGVKLVWDIDGDPAEVGNGYYENGVIHMNKRAKSKATVFAHEYVHYIEQSKLWPAFKKFIESTKAYENWITVQGNHSDVKQAEKNYKSKLETAYNKAGKKIADTDIIANFIAEGLFGGNYDGSAETNAETLLQEFAKNDKWYHNLARFFKGVISRLKGDKVQAELLKMERILQRARKDAQKNPTTDTGGRKYSISQDETFSKYCSIIDSIVENDDISKKGDYIKISQQTPTIIIEKASAKNLPMAIQFDSAYLETRRNGKLPGNYHNLGADNMKLLPKLLETPEYIIRLPNGRLNVVVDMSTTKRKQALVSIELEQSKQIDGKFDKYNLIITAFGAMSNYLQNSINNPDNEVLYNREAESQGTDQLHEGLDGINDSASMNILPDSIENVNENSSKPYSVTPASEADTIARLAAEGRVDEYKTEKSTSKLDARKTAELLLKGYKSTSDADLLTASIEKMKGYADASAWDAVIKEAETAAGIIFENAEIKSSKKDIAMGIFNQLVESRESIHREQLADVQSKNVQYRKKLSAVQDYNNYLESEARRNRKDIKEEVELERKEAADRTKNLEAIKRAVRSLDSKLRTNSNAKHIPEEFKNSIRRFCMIFVENDTSIFKSEELSKLLNHYRKLVRVGSNGEVSIAEGYLQEVDLLIEEASETLNGKKIRDLSNFELISLKTISENLLSIINDENTIFLNEKKLDLQEVGNRTLDELEKKKDKLTVHITDNQALRETLTGVKEFFGTENLKPLYVLNKLGGTFSESMENLFYGQEKCVRRAEAAKLEVQELIITYKYWEWANDKKSITLNLEKGGTVNLTVGKALSLYATYKRESGNMLQNSKHLEDGGFLLDEPVKVRRIKSNGKESKLYYDKSGETRKHFTKKDFDSLCKQLTVEQREFADAIVEYMSTVMGSYGNEVSMSLYGIRRYTENYYFPYKVASDYLIKDNQDNAKSKKQGKKATNPSFAHQTVSDASTPIVIRDFLETCATHMAEMCEYSTMTLPIRSLRQIFNFVTVGDNGDAKSVIAEIERVAGKETVNYISKFLDDIEGGIISDNRDNIMQKMTSAFKKNAVFASASVVVQQPSAVCRAFAVIDPKYFVKTTLKLAERNYAELKKYCPVAVLKEIGRFDTGSGQQFSEWMTDRKYSGGKEKIKAFFTDSNFRDDKMSWFAAKADEITWAHIWAAAKAQIKATTDFKVGSEEYFQAAAKLFNEAIEKTQVYDSVLTKSGNMRSKSSLMQMATAFMAEPTTSLNMLWQAVNEVKGKNYKGAGKLVGSVLSSIIFNAILKSLVTAARDDDEDESYAEKYLQEVVANFMGDVGIWNMIPVVKDVASIFEGYTVDRTDVSLIEDLYRGFQTFNSDKKSGWEKTKALIGPLAAFFGLPVKNVIRDGEAAWNVITMFLEGRILGSGTAVKYAMLNGLTGNDSGNGQYYEMLYDAQREGDEEKYQEVYDLLVSKGVDEKDIKTGIRKYYRESKAVKRELESYEEKIVRMTYYDKLEEEKRDNVISKIRTYLVEKAVSNDTGEELSSSTKKAIKAEEKGVSAATYFLASAGFEDSDASGGISNKEKIAAINKMDISHDEKVVLISLYTSREKSK